MSDDTDDGAGPGYNVGYGKPPVNSQFKKGQSGNPRGKRRDSGQKSSEEPFAETLRRVATRKRRVRCGENVEQLSALEVSLERLAVMASGNGTAKDTIIFLKLVAEYLPDLLKAPPPPISITYQRAPGSTVALPPADLYERDDR